MTDRFSAQLLSNGECSSRRVENTGRERFPFGKPPRKTPSENSPHLPAPGESHRMPDPTMFVDGVDGIVVYVATTKADNASTVVE